MAFDARKAWVKKKVMGALKLEDLSLWNSLMARVSLECLRRAFTAAAFPGGKHETQSDFIHLYNSYVFICGAGNFSHASLALNRYGKTCIVLFRSRCSLKVGLQVWWCRSFEHAVYLATNATL